MFDKLIYAIPAAGALALLFALWKSSWINKQPAGSDTMVEIGGYIREGAMAFLKREYKVLAIFVVVVAAALGLANHLQADSHWAVAVSFVVGAVCSGLAGFFGMRVATAANVRTTNAAREGLNPALMVAFSGGAVMGMSVVGLAVVGLGVLYIVFGTIFDALNTAVPQGVTAAVHATALMASQKSVVAIISGFSLGASSIALFARVGGGIYTKAADVGADLVGKVEAGIPEDDPRNPATIADNVGDNVGDVAGMGADLFESFVGSIVGSMVLGAIWIPAISEASGGGTGMALNAVLLPLVLAAAGIVVSIVATFFVRTREGGDPQKALNVGTLGAALIMAALTFVIIRWMLPATWITTETVAGKIIESTFYANGVYAATVVGLAAGVAIGLITEYYTSEQGVPSRQVAAESTTGPATNIIAGLALGMRSTAAPLVVLAVAIVAAYNFAGLYGIAIGALGMLSTTGIQLAVDAYGPIADNAGGIAEMDPDCGPEVRKRTDKLDAVGNTTAAIGKGFAIGSAALTALALFSAFKTTVMPAGETLTLDVSNPTVMAGLFLGAMLPYLFSSMSMNAVGEAAQMMIEEVRRQFREIPGLREGKEGVKAEYAKCVDISTTAAIRQMIAPGLLAVTVPVVAGLVSVEFLGGLLAGVTVSGVLLAIFMSNAGGAWDNAKKHIEGGAHGGKGSDAHKAAVVGDTVGDPFKDTSGPSLNILIKLMSVVALVIAPLLQSFHFSG